MSACGLQAFRYAWVTHLFPFPSLQGVESKVWRGNVDAGRELMQINSLPLKSQIMFLFCEAYCNYCLCYGYFLIPALSPVCLIRSLCVCNFPFVFPSLFLPTLTSSFSSSQVNGMNISTLRHSEVVALIREAGGEVRFLVVDQETYDFFQIIRITPTVSHVKG